MNVFDFDNTILRGDSSALFLLYCLKRHPKILLKTPAILSYVVRFAVKTMKKQTFKQNMFRTFLTALQDPEAEVELFWNENEHRVKDFYRRLQRPDDIVISASPEFLIRPICARLGIANVLASPVDIHSGAFSGPNCQGAEKPIRFQKAYPDAGIDGFYSDSLSDTPMAMLAKHAFLVKNEKLLPWPDK